VKGLNLTDIQFNENTQVSAKLRRLVSDLIGAERAVNDLIASVSTLQGVSTGTVTAEGLTLPLTIKGGTAGEVLQALSATKAAFAALTLEHLSDTFVVDPNNGQVLTYERGQWVNADVPTVAAPPIGGVNIGDPGNVPLYAGLEGANLAFRSLVGDSATIGITYTADTIQFAYIGGAISGPQGLQGPPGVDGADGEDGIMGPPGRDGVGGGVGGGLSFAQVSAITSIRL
jgi:hypothetical protein